MPIGHKQLPLDLPHEAAMTRADFIVGKANRAAAALVDRWPNWPARVVLLAGPVGSGKTHLGHAWAAASGAKVTKAVQLGASDLTLLLSAGGLLVEDLHEPGLDETALFHLLNLAGEHGADLLITSRVWPAALGLKLPDLVSRLRAAHPVELSEPDDELLRAVLIKLFADRQVAIDSAVIDFLALRMERSLGAAVSLVERLDRDALAAGRPITRNLAAQVLRSLSTGEPGLPFEG